MVCNCLLTRHCWHGSWFWVNSGALGKYALSLVQTSADTSFRSVSRILRLSTEGAHLKTNIFNMWPIHAYVIAKKQFLFKNVHCHCHLFRSLLMLKMGQYHDSRQYLHWKSSCRPHCPLRALGRTLQSSNLPRMLTLTIQKCCWLNLLLKWKDTKQIVPVDVNGSQFQLG